MSCFIQLHVITSYPPSNLNRDDLGRPKSALVGGVTRLRVSSQSLKRAWRTAPPMTKAFGQLGESHLGRRTRRVGSEWILTRLVKDGVAEDIARNWAVELQRAYGDPDTEQKDSPRTKQLVHVAPLEEARLQQFLSELAQDLLGKNKSKQVEEVKSLLAKRDKSNDKKQANITLSRQLADILLVRASTAVDIALFGRMLAAAPAHNFEAAAQVAHGFTVHKASAEDDYFTAVDDLNPRDEDIGAGHVNEAGFGAGVYYLYVCINRDLLDANLGGDTALRDRALAALIEAIATVSPTGKQASFASRAYASFMLAEKGSQQPRSLSLAFVKPITGNDVIGEAIRVLNDKLKNMDKVYGACADSRTLFNAETGEGTLAEVIAFAQAQ
jgi:CRISPR system Cascade subunit CasC